MRRVIGENLGVTKATMKQYVVILKNGREFKIDEAAFQFISSEIKQVNKKPLSTASWWICDGFIVSVPDIAAIIGQENVP